MQINPHRWYYNLPPVLLSIRNTPKAEIECCPAELVFGQSVALPGQFVSATDNPYTHQSDMVQKLSEHFAAIHPSNTRIKSHYTHHVHRELKSCSHVWLRNDFVKGPFQPKYSGPYEVVSRSDKVFTINAKDSLKTVSIDRLKVAHLPSDVSSSVIPVSSDFDQTYHNSNNANSPYTTRSGRIVKRPSCFQNYVMTTSVSTSQS